VNGGAHLIILLDSGFDFECRIAADTAANYREEIRNCGRGVERVGRAIRQLPDREGSGERSGS